MVKALVALGQVPKEEKKAAPPKLGPAEVDRIVSTLGVDDRGRADLRAQALKVVNSCPLAQWPKELAKLYGAKESDLKSKVGTLMKLPFMKPLALIDI